MTYFKHTDSEFQVPRLELFHNFLYLLNSVRHGHGIGSGLKIHTWIVGCS